MADESISLPSIPAKMDQALGQYLADQQAKDKAAMANAYQQGGMYAAQDEFQVIKDRESGSSLAALPKELGVAIDIQVHGAVQEAQALRQDAAGAVKSVEKKVEGFWDSALSTVTGLKDSVVAGIDNTVASTRNGLADDLKGISDSLKTQGTAVTEHNSTAPVSPGSTPAMVKAAAKSGVIEI
jgi:hypothetical protein